MQVRCWVKAFIPEAVYSASGQEITWRPNVKAHGSMLPLQPYLPSITASYATDQRTFSDDINASARITTSIQIPTNDDGDVVITRYSDPTIQFRKSWMGLFTFQDGSVESLTASPSGKQFIAKSANKLNIFFSTQGSNPFFSVAGFSYAPPIIMHFNLGFELQEEDGQLQVSLQGLVSQFPAFEAYLQIDNQAPMVLLRHEPRRGHTPFNLMYGATESVKGSVTLSAYNCIGLFAAKNVKDERVPVVRLQTGRMIQI